MRSRSSLVPMLCAAAAVLLCACVHGMAPSMRLKLAFTPKDDTRFIPGKQLDALTRLRIRVAPFIDHRPNPDLVGKNIQEGERPIYAADDLSTFLTASFISVLTDNGIPLVATGGERVITGEVLRFFVTEDGTYTGDVTLRFTLSDGAGHTLWQSAIDGRAHRFGSSYSPENYAETWSTAYLDAIRELFETKAFIQALERPPSGETVWR